MIAPESIQQVQQRIDIIDIIGSFIKLKKRGQNYLGLCPFHNEKSPSFTVSPAKEIYKCFGCGRSGNAIGFLMEHEKYSYVETIRWLAAKYNIELEETQQSEAAKEHQQHAESLYIVNSFATEFFASALLDSEEGKTEALSYLQERGFRKDIIEKFQIGYDPAGGQALAQAALDAKYSEDLLQKSGLLVQRNGTYYDNYRGRIIFPIHNQSGKVLGFGARIIKKNDKAPKYINTPENEIYVKSKILYGIYQARQAINKLDECLLVEGYTDVVSLQQAGIEHVVASGGTSLTPDQLRLIKKYTQNLTIIYDGDGAGISAALRGLDLALEEGLHVKMLLLPTGEDPDSYVYKLGAQGFEKFIQENKKDFILFQLEVAMQQAGDDTTKKLATVNQIAETISKINKAEDFARRQDYVRKVASSLQIEEAGLNNLVNKFIREQLDKPSYQKPDTQPKELDDTTEEEQADEDVLRLLQKDVDNEKALIRNLLEFGDKNWEEEQTVAAYLIAQIEENELHSDMSSELLAAIYEIYKNKFESGETLTDKAFLYHSDEAISRLVIDLMTVPTELSANWEIKWETKVQTRDDLYKEEIVSVLNYLKLKKIKKLIEENQKQMQASKDSEEMIVFMKTHQALKQMEFSITKDLGTVILK